MLAFRSRLFNTRRLSDVDRKLAFGLGVVDVARCRGVTLHFEKRSQRVQTLLDDAESQKSQYERNVKEEALGGS